MEVAENFEISSELYKSPILASELRNHIGPRNAGVCFVQPSEEVLYVLLYAHLDQLHSILECEFRRPRVGRTFGRGDPLSPSLFR